MSRANRAVHSKGTGDYVVDETSAISVVNLNVAIVERSGELASPLINLVLGILLSIL